VSDVSPAVLQLGCQRMTRPIRDILAECMRRERLGLIRPLWHDALRFAEDECERVRQRADHLTRLLASYGVRLVQDEGETPAPPSLPESPIIYRYWLVGNKAERLIRKGADMQWEIVTVAGGVETIEMSFTIEEALLNGGLVLTDDPRAKKLQGLGRQLAALAEIYRLCATAMEAPAAPTETPHA